MSKGEMTEEVCDICGVAITISIQEFEATMTAEGQILCDECFRKALDAQEKEDAANKPKRQFEYWSGIVIHTDFDQVGVEGFELVTIAEGIAYFKKEIL